MLGNIEDFSGTKLKANVITVKDYWKSFDVIFIDFHLLSVCSICCQSVPLVVSLSHLLSVCPIYSLLSVSIVLLFWHWSCCYMELCSNLSIINQLLIQMLILLHFHLKLACSVPLQFEQFSFSYLFSCLHFTTFLSVVSYCFILIFIASLSTSILYQLFLILFIILI
jgi:hypothetical protein